MSIAAILAKLQELGDEASLHYDTFLGTILVDRETKWGSTIGPWSDRDDTRLEAWLCAQDGFKAKAVSLNSMIRRAVDLYAWERRSDCLAEWLEGLKWDGRERLPSMLRTHFNAIEDGPDVGRYLELVGRYWMTGAVARGLCRDPKGVKFDAVLILEGLQSRSKSKSFAVLGRPYYSDTELQPGAKGLLQLQGIWIYELAELEILSRRELAGLKAFVTALSDRFVLPYGHRAVTMPRRCAFVGTVNKRSYLADTTGNRRWWPVRVNRIDIAALERDREQLWAEAVAIYQMGAHFWPQPGYEEHLFAAHAEARRMQDPWEDEVDAFVEDGKFVAFSEVCRKLGLEPNQRSNQIAGRINAIFDARGWSPRRARGPQGKTVRGYGPPTTRDCEITSFESTQQLCHEDPPSTDPAMLAWEVNDPYNGVVVPLRRDVSAKSS